MMMESTASKIEGSITNSPTLVQGKDIVIVSLHPWYFETGSNSKNIARYLSEHNRVLYVNIPIKRKAYLSKNPDSKIEKHISIIKDKQEKIKKISANLWEFYPSALVESVNWLPSTKVMKGVTYINNRSFANDIQQAISTLGFRDIILFNDNEIYNGFYLKKFLKPYLYIYYMRDFLQGYPFWKKHVSKLEPELLRKADLVVANSLYYAEYSLGFNKNSHYIGQGCVFNAFDHTRHFEIPEDIRNLHSPIIGYVGALDSSRLDTAIIESIAQHNPSWSVVLVGPEDDVFKQSSLHEIANIHFLGGKPFDLLPAYVKAFDICINPQLKNEITKGNYPLKIDEYLAMGKPVVATRTLAMKIFEAQTYLADEPHQYPDLISKALTENSAPKEKERIAFARTHTWENCISELYKAIQTTYKQKKHLA